MSTLTVIRPSYISTILWRLRAWLRRNEPSNYETHARRELKAAGFDDSKEEGPNKWIQENVLELLRAFSKQGHSGHSAPYCISLFTKLASFEPLVPLSGADEEWCEVMPGTFQNKRCSHVFKQQGNSYDINGIIWRDPDGSCFTNFESRVPVTFPYTPKREYRDRPAVNGNGEPRG
jgi:hypothetical protein